MKKLLLFWRRALEEIEALTVVDILRRAEVEVDMCSLSEEYVNGAHNIKVKSDLHLDDLIKIIMMDLFYQGDQERIT